MDKRALHDELTDAFIRYQHRLDFPFPSATETTDCIIQKYRTDPIFHAKVVSLVSGVMCIVDKHATLREKAAMVDELQKRAERMQKALSDIAEWTDRYTTPGHPISNIARAAIAKENGK